MQLKVKAIGLPEAEALTRLISAAVASYKGCDFARNRDDGTPEGSVVTWLAEGNPERDLRTLSSTEEASVASAFMDYIARRVQVAKKRGRAATPQLGNAIGAGAWRAAGGAYSEIMRNRINNEETVGGAPAAKVGKPYADWRNRKYGVPVNRVYKATGQLLSHLNPANITGSIRLIKF